jgi:hypothetical protein
MEKLRRTVIKEELVALTGDFKKAIVLNQMIYWSEKRKDADKFLQEEIERMHAFNPSKSNSQLIDILESSGWIYKKAEELSEETMIGVKPKAMREYLKALVENGWLHERRNPKEKWDKTLQYRVNLLKIQLDLNNIGFALDGYSLPKVEKEGSNLQKENTEEQKENRKVKKENSEGLKRSSNTIDYSEITPEITSKEYEREDIIIAILKNYEFHQDDIMHILSDFSPMPTKDFKKHLFIKQASEMRMKIKGGETIYHKPKYFRNGYKIFLEADNNKMAKKSKQEAEQESTSPIPFYNWLEQ